MERKPIPWRPLCAIAAVTLTADPVQTESEWIETVKRELLRQGWDYPTDRDALTKAMQAVQTAWEKVHGRRPVRPPSPQVSTQGADWRGPLTREESTRYLQAVRNWQQRSSGSGSSSTLKAISYDGRPALVSLAEIAQVTPTETAEDDADRFFRQVREWQAQEAAASQQRPPPIHQVTPTGFRTIRGKS